MAPSLDYLADGSGAEARSVADKLAENISVKDFGAIGDGSTDDTAALQACLNAVSTSQDLNVVIPAGTYKCHGLTSSTGDLRITALGTVILMKNGNGPIITLSGDSQELNGISFYGGSSTTPEFTGDNIYSTSNNLRLINCGSRRAAGRAVLAQGNHTQIIGTCDIYQTADEADSGYDIELGNSGAVTLYSTLIGVYSSQLKGGVKLVKAGGAFISNCQFGKLHLDTNSGGFIGGNRVGGAATFLGPNTTVDCNGFAGGVTIGDGTTPITGFMFGPGNIMSTGTTFTLSALVTDGSLHLDQLQGATLTLNLASALDNAVWHGYVAYDPAMSTTGSPPDIGNGSISGCYTRSGRSFTAAVQLNLGSTTSLGTGGLIVSLPFDAGTHGAAGPATFIDSGVYVSGSAFAAGGTNDAFIAFSAPPTPANSDFLVFRVSGSV